MRVGLLARGDDTGLGVQTWEFFRAMQPRATMLVEMGEGAHRRFTSERSRFPWATVMPFVNGEFTEVVVRRWLEGLDVVFSAETFYDQRFYDWSQDAGVATVVQANPELLRPLREWPQYPSAWWAGTSWRLDSMPEGTRVVPVPVADDRFAFRPVERDGALRVLHIEGHRALADRNGTTLLYDALRRVIGPMRVTVMSQERRLLPFARRTRPGVTVLARPGGAMNYWEMYQDHDVLVLPRRYGGLCLPAQEAMAAGLAVVMTDAEPQRSTWPVLRVKASRGQAVPMQCGPVELVNADTRDLASVLSELAANPRKVREAQEAGVEWALAHRWSQLLPMYQAELELAVKAPIKTGRWSP